MSGSAAPALLRREESALYALALMVGQYLESDGEPESMGIAAGTLDTLFMSAGESALLVLAEHGLVRYSPGDRTGEWTDAGLKLLDRRDL